ncbi:TIR domain-containing protein [Roseibium polysiphoniae]|uniref:TIR domain-containing protein n=1 Tax=Roseibium polysiphoniae TaxID=2571221 RepID=A0ABR9C655_9HYPH|nr:TIR domain-containing protein [Roseibium polysiphoniae]MBD8875414.1 TIR domain-containing protein [Roseibium polysiphoniae]
MHVFVSHSWSYSDHYERLAEWIFEEAWYIDNQRIHFFNTSVPRDDPIHFAPNDAILQQAIYQRIANSHVLVIPTGMYVNHSKWIQKEIDGAQLYGRPIVAVDPWAQQRTSSVVADAADESTGWNKLSIINAVWRLGNRR